MRRCLGWTLLAMIVVSLLVAPAASARPDRDHATAGPADWTRTLFGWLSALVPGGAPTAIVAPDATSPSIDPNGLLPGTEPAVDEEEGDDSSPSIDPNG